MYDNIDELKVDSKIQSSLFESLADVYIFLHLIDMELDTYKTIKPPVLLSPLFHSDENIIIFMKDLFLLFFIIALTYFFAEMGDKTLFLLIVLSTKYKLRNIIFGTLIAIISVFITFFITEIWDKIQLSAISFEKEST